MSQIAALLRKQDKLPEPEVDECKLTDQDFLQLFGRLPDSHVIPEDDRESRCHLD